MSKSESIRSITCRVALMLGVTCVASIAGGMTLSAQSRGPEAGEVEGGAWLEGLVLDAETSLPIVGARITIMSTSDAAANPREVRSDAAGAYRFLGGRTGSYRVSLRALGYRPRVIEVRLEPASPSHVSVALQLTPTLMAPVRVVSPPEPFGLGREQGALGEDPLWHAERVRHGRQLSGDVRALTHAEVAGTVAVGEHDPMRTLQRSAGASARDDYSAAVWSRGASWDHTVVYFDGIPLWNPFHAAGMVSALDANAIGSVWYHPSVQPAGAGHAASALVEVSSRRGTGRLTSTGGLASRTRATVSLVGTSVALDGSTAGGRAAWMLAARRSHVDALAGAYARLTGDADRRVPYVFHDVTMRGDLHVGRWRLESSALLAGDRLRDRIDHVVDGATGRWGTAAARATVVVPLWSGESRTTLSASGFETAITAAVSLPDSVTILQGTESAGDSTVYALLEQLYRPQPITSRVTHVALSGSWESAQDSAGVSTASAGYEITAQRAGFTTTGNWPHGRAVLGSTDSRAARSGPAVWAERRWRPGEDVHVVTGLRFEAGERIVLPRLSARWSPTPSLAFSVGAGWHAQYLQSVSPAGPGRNAVATTGTYWTIPDRGSRAATSRTHMLGVERWIGRSALATATAYHRSTNGLALPDPRPGVLLDRPLYVRGDSRSTGIELALRRLRGMFTGGVALSHATAVTNAVGHRFPSAGHRPFVVHSDGQVRLPAGWRAGAAYTYAAGAPFTRYHGGAVICDEAECHWSPPPRTGDPSAARASGYRSLDLAVDWTRRRGTREFVAFVQLRNVTAARNEAAYLSTSGRCADGGVDSCNVIMHPTSLVDTRLPGVALLPTAGVRLGF